MAIFCQIVRNFIIVVAIKSLMLSTIAWNNLFSVALKVYKILGPSDL